MDDQRLKLKALNAQEPSFWDPGVRPLILEGQLSGLPEEAKKKFLTVCESVIGLAEAAGLLSSVRSMVKEEEPAGSDRFAAAGLRPEAERMLRDYFTCMVDFLKAEEEERYSFLTTPVDYSRAVETLYLIGCERDKKNNCYYIPQWHPVRLMDKFLDGDLEQLLAEDRTEESVLKAVFDGKNRSRRQLKLFCRNQVYETVPEDSGNYITAHPFRQLAGNTEIPYLRIWEKVRGYRERHHECARIKVAVFGKLAGDPGLVNKLLNYETEVKWVFFENTPLMGEYYFQDDSGEEIYELSDLADVKELVSNYNIILFLDINCLYRQWQSEKTAEEQNEGSHCQWYLDRSRVQTAFKEKAAYYRSIYHHVGLWLNSLRQQNSSSFEFDLLLFRNLVEASDEDTDVYLYIKDSNRIASHNLEYSGVCNDERYDGKQLLVCKLARTDKGSFNRVYGSFLEQSRGREAEEEGYSYVSIKLWKIIKSIGNEYCGRFLEEECNDKVSPGELVKALDASYLTLGYKVNADEKKIELGYGVHIAAHALNVQKRLSKRLWNLSEAILSYALETENMYCVRRYFKELLIHSVITNAGSVQDLVFAHIWSQPWMKTELTGIDMEDASPENKNYSEKHKLCKTIFVIIERMENLRMRTIPDMRGYILNTFRNIVSPEVDVENFRETLHCIAECCRKFHHTGSSLFLNSTLVDEQEEMIRERG